MTCSGCNNGPQYNDRLMVKKPGTTRDAAGHIDLTNKANWQFVQNIWARFITKGGRESYVFKQTQADTTHVIETPWTPDAAKIVPKWRMELGDRVFELTAAYDVDEQHQVMRFEAIEAK